MGIFCDNTSLQDRVAMKHAYFGALWLVRTHHTDAYISKNGNLPRISGVSGVSGVPGVKG
jgi:hypothetical protein